MDPRKAAVKNLINEFLSELNKPVKAAVRTTDVVAPILPPTAVQSPAVVIPSRLNEIKEAVRQSKGNYGVRRLERAADEIPNLESLYNEQALRSAFKGDNAQALMTMNPADFEKYAAPIPRAVTNPDATRHQWHEILDDGRTLTFSEYIDHLRNLKGFKDVPFLVINKEEQGLPLIPFLHGHEGRHRNRAMTESGEQAGLVQLFPEGELREPFPRRDQEEYLDSLKKELGLTDNLVLPEKYIESGESLWGNQIQRPAIKLPDIYAEGGEVHAAGGGLKQAVKGKIDEFLAGLKVKPPSDNIAVVKSANFEYPKVIGNQTLKVNDVSGGVRMSDPYERKRVEALAQKMSSPNGYISRIIVDHKNNVIEGQHRLEALRHLGIEDVPVYKIEDLSDTMPVASMESALNAVAPIHPDHVNQLIGHALEDIAEHGIDHAKTLDYGKYQKFYDAALDAAFPDLKKAAGGEVHMDKGGDPMLADLIERYNTPRNKSRYSAGIFDSNAPGEVRSVTPTVKERMASGLQAAMEAAGSDRSKARQRAQTIIGGPNSRLPGGFGVADIGAMVNPTVAAAMIPVYAESAMHDLANVPDALKRGDYVGAGVDTAFGLMDLIPAVGQGKKVAKGVAKGIKDAVTSDAGYDLAQRVLNATGTAPMQIMIGPKAKTFRHDAAALAAQMEKEGKNRKEIWQATKTMRAPDNEFRQELSDLAMRYNSNTAKDRQFETEKQRFLQAANRATSREELDDAEKYFESQVLNLQNNPIGKAQEFIEHPELFEAYPELSNYVFRQLEPTNSQFYAPESVQGYFSPGEQRITINSNAPNKRSTALHELQHAIQEIEGWQGGASPEYMATKLAERDVFKDAVQKQQELLDSLSPTSILRPSVEKSLQEAKENFKPYELLEGLDPYDAYRRVSGEEEARMVQARRNYPEEKLAKRPPYIDYEADPSLHITDFADGGAVMMAGGKDVTKEAIKQGVKKGIDAVEEFLKSLRESKNPAAKMAPQDEALRLAQFRATLPPEQGGFGLPANNTPMQRATAMGHTTPAYHSTKQNPLVLLPRPPVSSRRGVDFGVHVGTNPETANGAIIPPWHERVMRDQATRTDLPESIRESSLKDLEGYYNQSQVMPLLVNTGESLKVPDFGRWNSSNNMLNAIAESSGEWPNYVLRRDVKTNDLDALNELIKKSILSKSEENSDELHKQAIENILKERGYGSIAYPNSIEGSGDISLMFVDPDRIRSRFAAFDPWRRDAATAAAFGVAAPDLLAKEQEKPEDRLTIEEFLKTQGY